MTGGLVSSRYRVPYPREQGWRLLPTGASYCLVMIRASHRQVEEFFSGSLSARGVAGGVVSQTYFEEQFGIINPNGTVNKSQDVTVSSNVVSVLQAGAFFGALGSAPLSGRRLDHSLCVC